MLKNTLFLEIIHIFFEENKKRDCLVHESIKPSFLYSPFSYEGSHYLKCISKLLNFSYLFINCNEVSFL
jgi:hypothetical protein